MLRVSGGSNSIKVERRTQREASDNWGRVRRRWIPQDLTCNLLVNSCPCPMGESGGDDNMERPVCTQYQAKQGVRLSYQLEGWGRGLVGGGGVFAIRDGSLFRGLRRGITVLALACLMGSNGWAIGTGGSGGSLMKVETLPWSMWVEEMVCKDPSVHIAKQKGGEKQALKEPLGNWWNCLPTSESLRDMGWMGSICVWVESFSQVGQRGEVCSKCGSGDGVKPAADIRMMDGAGSCCLNTDAGG
ncbi:hypothetical protein EDD17DRAFT_1503420 [Pisolithus thermaeus]|nr:hypothetical protein EDD17DRAFT_1503420 [Pisolithus thermaeus]